MFPESLRFFALVAVVHSAYCGSLRAGDVPKTKTSPNLLIEISQSLASAIAETPLNRCDPVRDNILQTDIYGCGCTRGRVSVSFVPCEEAALLEMVMNARIDARTVGYNGPVQLFSTSTSIVNARKRVCFDIDGIRYEPANSVNRTDTTLQGLATSMRGHIMNRAVSRIAHRRYERDKELARQIGESHVNERVATGFDNDVAPELLRANQSYREKIRLPLEKRGLFPESLATRTTSTTMCIAARISDSRVGAISNPPMAATDAEGTLYVHQSVLNVAAERMLAGRTITESRLREELEGLWGNDPKPQTPEDKDIEISFVFPKERPVEFTFENKAVRILIRGAKMIEKRAVDAEPIDRGRVAITATYELEATATGFRALRQGELDVQFFDVPGNTTRVALRALVRRHLAEALKTRFELDQIKLPDEFKKIGTLVPSQLQASQGWLVMGIKRAS